MTSRWLFLAGGGLKIAYQAGVLQVWLDEAGVEFDHVDAVSAASFNLAMWCSGQDGTAIADHWRSFHPLDGIAVNWRGLAAGPFGSSLLTLDRLQRNVLPTWDLDWEIIRHTGRSATFNLYDFTRQRLDALGEGGGELSTLVVVRADKAATYGSVRGMLAAAQAQGFARFSLIVMREGGR